MVAPAYNPSPWEAKAWSQTGLCSVSFSGTSLSQDILVSTYVYDII